jgi:nucleoid DNA-binding protein
MTLTKDHQIDAIAKENRFQKKLSIEIVEALLKIIKAESGDWQDMMLETRKVVTFKCSGKLRDKINKSRLCASV